MICAKYRKIATEREMHVVLLSIHLLYSISWPNLFIAFLPCKCDFYTVYFLGIKSCIHFLCVHPFGQFLLIQLLFTCKKRLQI